MANFLHDSIPRGSGESRTYEYRTWRRLIDACCNPNYHGYVSMGAVGIPFHPEWQWNYDQFIADVGRRPAPNWFLSRIIPERGYVPGNVEWRKSGVRFRTTPVANFGEELLDPIQYAARHNVSYSTALRRVKAPPATPCGPRYFV